MMPQCSVWAQTDLFLMASGAQLWVNLPTNSLILLCTTREWRVPVSHFLKPSSPKKAGDGGGLETPQRHGGVGACLFLGCWAPARLCQRVSLGIEFPLRCELCRRSPCRCRRPWHLTSQVFVQKQRFRPHGKIFSRKQEKKVIKCSWWGTTGVA